MSSIHFDLPEGIERCLGGNTSAWALAAKESFLVDLYRVRRITLHQLAEALGLGRIEMEAVLDRHGVLLDFGRDDLENEADLLRRTRP